MQTLLHAASSRRLFTTAILMMLTVDTAAYAEDWPQWRGPNSTGLSRSKKPLPVNFSSTDHVRWSVELGEGVCSPTIVAGRCPLLMTARDRRRTRDLIRPRPISG